MNKLLSIGTTAATVLTVTVATSGTALAWHPKAELTKFVRNDTKNTQFVDANNANTAVVANPGDVLTYQIDVRNVADNHGENDLYKTVITDQLPAGVELVSDASQRNLTFNDYKDVVIKPGQTKSVKFQVKVTSTKEGDLLTNKACVTGDSKVNDQPQNDCDVALVKVNVPKAPETPAPVKETPQQPGKTMEAPVELPKTGISATAIIATSLTALAAYAAAIIRARRVNA